MLKPLQKVLDFCTRRHYETHKFHTLARSKWQELVLSSWFKVRITTYELLTTHSNTIQPSNYNDKYLEPFSDACTPQKNSLCLESRKCCNVFLRQNEALPFCPAQLKWQKVLHVHMKPLRLSSLRQSKLSPISKRELQLSTKAKIIS